MQQVEKGTVIHHNLSLLHKVLWPDEGVEILNDVGMFIFHRWEDTHEIMWVRFVKGNLTFTFSTDRYWTKVLNSTVPLDALDESILTALKRPRAEYPSDYLAPRGDQLHDSITQEEILTIERMTQRLRQKMEQNLREITLKANRLTEVADCRDHELYLTFNIGGEDNLDFFLRLDKVYPKLPEGGFKLGLSGTFEHDIKPDDRITQKSFQRMVQLQNRINKDIAHYRGIAQLGEEATKVFDKEIKTLLFAATHFTKRLYPVNGQHAMPEVERVANDILDRLHRGSLRMESLGATSAMDKIALDVSSWVVWIYPADGSKPLKCTDPELDFKELILEGYVESFTKFLMGYLMDLQSPKIRPYHYLVKADKNDGHAIGSIRQS